MTRTKTYRIGFPYDYLRKKDEEKMLAEGWTVLSIEEKKRRDWGSTCCLVVVFFPLALLPWSIKEVTVTYGKE